MSDTYSIVQGDVPGGPPVNLPPIDVGVQRPKERLRITVGAKPQREGWHDYPLASETEPVTADRDVTPQEGWQAYPLASEGEPQGGEKPYHQVGAGEAVAKGAANALSFGTSGAIAGLGAAAGQPGQQALETEQQAMEANPYGAEAAGGAMLAQPFIGAARMAHQAFSAHPDPSVKEAYNRGREQWVNDERLAREQHPAAYVGGLLAGSLAMPAFGAFTPATAGARFAQGARAGGIGGALYGTGEAISEGKSPGEIAGGGVRGAVTGGLLGGGLGAAVGPRVAGAPTKGQRAAATAEGLGAPLPRGVVSERPIVQKTTAKLQELPLVGERIPERVRATQEAAGQRVEQIARGMGQTDRAAADAVLRPALQTVIDNNRTVIDTAYNALRGQIDQTQHYTMPQTDAALNRIMAARKAAGWVNPAQGLEQFRNVAGGATFNGAHRARVDAREAGNALVPHPGYNAADYNQITRAMTADLRGMVQASARGNPQAALRAFDTAEREFGRLAEENAAIHKLLKSSGTGATATLLGSANEIKGNLALLTQLRRSMPPQDFQQIGGLLLAELGHTGNMQDFSLARFTTNFNKVSDRALGILFSPQHLANIRDIAEMGKHIKTALAATTRGQSGGLIVLLDVAKDAMLIGHDIAAGNYVGGPGMMVGGASSALLYGTAWLLGNPARTAAAGAWARAYSGLTGNTPTPARIATFNIATRNLANTLGISAETITRRLQGQVHPRAEEEQPSSERPVR